MLEQNKVKMGGGMLQKLLEKQLNYPYLKLACPFKQNCNNSNQAFTTTQQWGKHTSLDEKKNQSIKSMAPSR